jgi:hypothetical protein
MSVHLQPGVSVDHRRIPPTTRSPLSSRPTRLLDRPGSLTMTETTGTEKSWSARVCFRADAFELRRMLLSNALAERPCSALPYAEACREEAIRRSRRLRQHHVCRRNCSDRDGPGGPHRPDLTAWTPPPEPTRAMLGNGKSRGEPVLRYLRYRLILVLRDGILVHHLFWTRISTVFPSQHLSPCACPNPL